jgi:transcriptional regulator with XRE-family HTH domain
MFIVRSYYMDNLEIINWIIQQREAVNVSQAILAEMVGLKQSCIAKIELNQRKLTVTEFLNICDALNVSEDIFINFLKSIYKKNHLTSIWERNE